MEQQPASTQQVITTTGSVAKWSASPPLVVGLIFGLAGAVFIGVVILRRIRGQVPKK